MSELYQCDDFFIPVFLLKLPTLPEINEGNAQAEDFLQNVQGWTEISPLEECVE